MKIHYLQHVPIEGLGIMEDWINSKGHQCTCTRLYTDDPLPHVDDIDWLIIMGGPMNIYDTDTYTWLIREKEFIQSAIDKELPVLGICLGAQLIADVLGAEITANSHKEIGWFPIYKNDELANSTLSEIVPGELDVFHWHGDTFSIPDGAIKIAESEACSNQGFIFNERVIGLQFHLETTKNGAGLMIENFSHDLTNGPFIQTPDKMLADEGKFRAVNKLMFDILDYQEPLSPP